MTHRGMVQGRVIHRSMVHRHAVMRLVLLTGEVSRSAFGASGYSNMVGDRIGLRVVAVIGK